MNNNAFCPISFKKVDEHVARLNGFFTVLLLIVYVLTSNVLPLIFLLLDFLARGFEKPQFSPLAIFSKFILARLNIKPQPINAGPKIFAARIGVLFSAIILLSALLGWQVNALVFTGIFGVCALLEASIGFCVACRIYPLLYKLVYQTNYKKLKFKSDFQI